MTAAISALDLKFSLAAPSRTAVIKDGGVRQPGAARHAVPPWSALRLKLPSSLQ